MRSREVFTPFEAMVHDFVRRVPKGRVTTYRGVAAALGKPGASRAVGNVMRHNPDTRSTPCHRVVRSDGRLGGYGGEETDDGRKAALLQKEGVRIRPDGRIENFERVVWP